MLHEICLADSYFDLSDDMVVSISKDEVVTDINKRGYELLGYPRDHVIGKNWFDNFVPEKTREQLRPLFHQMLEGKMLLERYENPVLTSGGERIVAWHNMLVRDSAGNVTGTLSSGEDITERNRVALSLQESEKKYRNMADSLAEGVFETDSSGAVTYANKKALASAGIDENDFRKGINIFDFISADYKNFARERFAMAISGAEIGPEKYVLRRKDGTTFPALVSTLPVNQDGSTGLRGVFIDITANEESEAEIAHLASFPELSPSPIVEADAAGDIKYLNPAARRLFPDLANLRGGHPFLGNWQMTVERLQETELPSVADDIAVGDSWFSRIVVCLKETRVFRVYGLDVTERHKSEQSLRESEEKYRSLFMNMPAGYALCQMVFDEQNRPADFVYLEVNDAFERLTGLRKNDVVGKRVTEAIPSINETNPEIIPVYGKVVLTGEPTSFEVFLKPLDIWLTISAYRPKDGYFVAVFDNITERKKAEERLRLRTRELEEANSELQQFAYVASHDLREPLRMVKSFTQLLQKKYQDKLDGDADEFIGFIVDGATRMQRLIDDLLLYSRVGSRSVPSEPVNMEDTLRDVLTNLKTSIEKSKAKITSEPMPTVQADPTQMIQILQNLVGNAIKFHREGEAPVVRISAKQEGNEWVFSVKDNGIGIAPEHIGRLFTLFQRLNPQDKYEGSGIGLAVAKRVVRRHGGRIWVESQPGKGSTFYFSIPTKVNGNGRDNP